MSIYGKKRNRYSDRLFQPTNGVVKGPVVPTIISSKKGKLYGNCNRTACQLAGEALFYNRYMGLFYCRSCATDLRKGDDRNGGMFPYFEQELDAHFYTVRSGEDPAEIRRLFDIPEH
jgi:hypothetical protein